MEVASAGATTRSRHSGRIHIAVDTMGDGSVPVVTNTGPTLNATRPKRRQHGMGQLVMEMF